MCINNVKQGLCLHVELGSRLRVEHPCWVAASSGIVRARSRFRLLLGAVARLRQERYDFGRLLVEVDLQVEEDLHAPPRRQLPPLGFHAPRARRVHLVPIVQRDDELARAALRDGALDQPLLPRVQHLGDSTVPPRAVHGGKHGRQA
eukprot:CAMPEP_0179881692 /NCGR_PEP_ID=MMETSP0982-20121206/27662_1 /TAXON_ID=483367 /ORGANISM="non described non described, Strain CCMP 2436" /LENGTH=146 /DNA_ID=CAMNT_0021775781 /DNA_START=121 /DNA_END=558 /DNA_ORIENTATION=-